MAITHAHMLETGYSANDISTMHSHGVLHRLRHGVYDHELADTHEDRHRALIAATLQVVHPTNVLSHTSAGLMHDLPIRRGAFERVTMIRTTAGHADKGRHLRVRNTRIFDEEYFVSDGARLTTLARTVADIARIEPQMWGVAAADAAMRRGATRDALWYAIQRHPRLHGVKKARYVARFANALAESPAESISRWNMSVAGLPTPVLQRELFDEQGEFVARVDFFWPEHGLVGEMDGKAKYNGILPPGKTWQDIFLEEKEREEKIRALGLWVVRWGWRVAIDPTELARTITSAIRAQQRRG